MRPTTLLLLTYINTINHTRKIKKGSQSSLLNNQFKVGLFANETFELNDADISKVADF